MLPEFCPAIWGGYIATNVDRMFRENGVEYRKKRSAQAFVSYLIEDEDQSKDFDDLYPVYVMAAGDKLFEQVQSGIHPRPEPVDVEFKAAVVVLDNLLSIKVQIGYDRLSNQQRVSVTLC